MNLYRNDDREMSGEGKEKLMNQSSTSSVKVVEAKAAVDLLKIRLKAEWVPDFRESLTANIIGSHYVCNFVSLH